MTRLPSDIAIGHLLDALRNLHTRPRDKTAPDRTLLANIERRLATAVRRDRTGTTTRDGYPTSTLGGGHATHIAGSTTENAALAPTRRDRHHDLTVAACQHLDSAVTHLQALLSALNSLEDLTGGTSVAPRTCQACTGYRPLGGDQAVAHRGTVGDRLTRDTDLCGFCWAFVRQAYPAGSRAGLTPTPTDIAHHDQTGRWRIRLVAG